MTVYDAYERRKDGLRQELSGTVTQADAEAALRRTLAHIAEDLARSDPDDTGRQRAQAVLAALSSSCSLLRAGDARAELVPGQKEAPAAKPVKLGGAGLILAVAAYEMLSGRIIPALVMVIGGLLLFGAQLIPAASGEARAAACCDADALVRELGALCRAADVCLSDLSGLEQESRLRGGAQADDALLTLMSSLLEARASGREDLALVSLDDVVQYLRRMNIEVVDYKDDPAAFDLLPTVGEARTIRPAFRRDGKLLRRGVAAVQEKEARA